MLLPIRMMSETPDMLYPIAVEEKELKMLIIASIQTLKRGKKKCGNEDVFHLVKDSVDGVIKKEAFNNLLDILEYKNNPSKEKKMEIGKPCPLLKKLYRLVTN